MLLLAISVLRRERLSDIWHTPFGNRDAGRPPVAAWLGYLLDVIVLVGVPALLFAVYALPESVRYQYSFHYTEPTLVTAFTAHYVHFSSAHLLGNLLGFLLIWIAGYCIFSVAGRRSLFRYGTVTMLLALPLGLSLLNLAIPRFAYGYGFSGITMGMLGLLPLGIALALGTGRNGEERLELVVPLFLVSVGFIAVVTLPGSRSTHLFAALTGATAIIYALALGYPGRHPGLVVRAALAAPIRSGTIALAVVVWLGYLSVGFPAVNAGAEGVVNLYAHFLGYALGLLGPYCTLIMLRSLEGRSGGTATADPGPSNSVRVD